MKFSDDLPKQFVFFRAANWSELSSTFYVLFLFRFYDLNQGQYQQNPVSISVLGIHFGILVCSIYMSSTFSCTDCRSSIILETFNDNFWNDSLLIIIRTNHCTWWQKLIQYICSYGCRGTLGEAGDLFYSPLRKHTMRDNRWRILNLDLVCGGAGSFLQKQIFCSTFFN